MPRDVAYLGHDGRGGDFGPSRGRSPAINGEVDELLGLLLSTTGELKFEAVGGAAPYAPLAP